MGINIYMQHSCWAQQRDGCSFCEHNEMEFLNAVKRDVRHQTESSPAAFPLSGAAHASVALKNKSSSGDCAPSSQPAGAGAALHRSNQADCKLIRAP